MITFDQQVCNQTATGFNNFVNGSQGPRIRVCKPPILVSISFLWEYRRLTNTPTYVQGSHFHMASGSEHKSIPLNNLSLHFCKHNNMTPPKKDSYSQAVASWLQSVISGSQIASSGHKNMEMSTVLPRQAWSDCLRQVQQHPHEIHTFPSLFLKDLRV